MLIYTGMTPNPSGQLLQHPTVFFDFVEEVPELELVLDNHIEKEVLIENFIKL